MKKLLVICLACTMILASFTACGSNKGEGQDSSSTQQEEVKTPELSEIADAVREVYGENYLPSMPMDEEMLSTTFDINMDDVDEFIAENTMISAQVDIFVAIKAKEGKGEAIEKQLTAYRDYVIENSFNYPMNVEKVNAIQVVRHGDYVFYVLLGGYPENMDASEEEQAKFAKEQVQIGLDTIASFF